MVLILSLAASAQSGNMKKQATEITVCGIELTGPGKTAEFHFNYVYLLTTDSVGDVSRIDQLHRDNPKLVNDEKLLNCIRSWKLKPVRNYSVMVSFGTKSHENLVSVSNEEEVIRIYFGMIGPEMKEDQKQPL